MDFTVRIKFGRMGSSSKDSLPEAFHDKLPSLSENPEEIGILSYRWREVPSPPKVFTGFPQQLNLESLPLNLHIGIEVEDDDQQGPKQLRFSQAPIRSCSSLIKIIRRKRLYKLKRI